MNAVRTYAFWIMNNQNLWNNQLKCKKTFCHWNYDELYSLWYFPYKSVSFYLNGKRIFLLLRRIIQISIFFWDIVGLIVALNHNEIKQECYTFKKMVIEYMLHSSVKLLWREHWWALAMASLLHAGCRLKLFFT